MKRRTGRYTAAVLVIAAVTVSIALACDGSTHSTTEPTWYFQGVVSSDAVKMKHVTVVHDPSGITGVPGEPEFMMWWGTSSPDQLYAQTSDDGLTWTALGRLSVSFPGTVVPVYHPEVIYDRAGFSEKKSTGTVRFKMWFYDGQYECPASYNWMRYAESADGIHWQVFEDSPDVASGGKNYLEFSSGSGNEVSVLYRQGGTGIVEAGVDLEYVGYQCASGLVGVSTDGAWFRTHSTSPDPGGPTDVCREMVIAADTDLSSNGVAYRAWDDLSGVTSWDSLSGFSWSSGETGDPPIVGAAWSDFYGAMSVVVVGDSYYMYDTMGGDDYSVGLLIAPLGPPHAVWVDDDWACQDDVDEFNTALVWGYDAFASIQDGIDAVASGGGVNVAAGTYTEAIAIYKPLTLRGATADANKNGYPVPPGYTWNDTLESIIQHPDPAGGYRTIVDIVDTDDVTFEGFVVQELGAVGNLNTSLVRVYAHTREIEHVVVRNNVIGPNTNTIAQDGAQGRMGLYIVNHPYDDHGVVRSSFSGNKIFDCQGNGNNVFLWSSYYAYGAPGPASMAGTVLEDNEICGAHRSGIETAGGFSGLTIRNNRIHDNSGPGDTPDLKYGNGILMVRGSGDRTLCDGYGPVDLTITGNEIYANEDHGIYMGPNNQGITIAHNSIHGNGADAIRIDLIGNYWNPDFDPMPGPYTCLGGSRDVTIWSNDIEGNGGGVWVIGTPTNGFVVVAVRNWWGSPTGPRRELPNGKWVGKGDTVSDHVDYRPCLPHSVEFFTVDGPGPLAGPAPLQVVAYPNPVRDVHTATFQLTGARAAEAEGIRVQVFDLSGHVVWEGAAPGGELAWHTENLAGEYLANGVYLYRVQALVDGVWTPLGEAKAMTILR